MSVSYQTKMLSLMETHDLTAARTAGRLQVMKRAVSMLSGIVDGMAEPAKTVAMIPLNNYRFQMDALEKVATSHGDVRLSRITEMRTLMDVEEKIFCEFTDMMNTYRLELENSLIVYDDIPIFCKRITLDEINVCIQKLLSDPAQGETIMFKNALVTQETSMEQLQGLLVLATKLEEHLDVAFENTIAQNQNSRFVQWSDAKTCFDGYMDAEFSS